MEKAIAVVVTYNRLSLLKNCITALHSQTRKLDAILVVDNGSTDGTGDWLKRQKNLFHIHQSNVGSGGGFHSGITWAYKNGYSCIWCMDDDGHPKENALEQLIINEPTQRSLLNCAVIDINDRESFVWKTKKFKTLKDADTNLIEGIAHPFNGTLIHRSIIEKVGVPESKFFLWGDESEYYYRITRKYKIPVYTVASSIHYHPAKAFNYMTDWDFSSSWKIYYYVRNRYHILKAKCGNTFFALINYICFLAAFTGIVLFFQKTTRIQKLKFILWPVKDALTNNFSTTPNVITSRLQNYSSENKFLDAFRNVAVTIFRTIVPVRSISTKIAD